VNIANANIFGLSTELKLKGNEYNTALVIFFVPYILFEIPSNIVLKRFRPRFWLSACMFLFGLATICQGLVKNYGGLLATILPWIIRNWDVSGMLLPDWHVVPKT
jgi:hypothetical protein